MLQNEARELLIKGYEKVVSTYEGGCGEEVL